MIPTLFGNFLKVLEISPFSRSWKVLEINIGSGKFWKFDYYYYYFTLSIKDPEGFGKN